MKKQLLIITLFLITSSTLSVAQTAKNEIQLFQNIYGMEKQAIITEALHLSVQEATTFWPIYDQYEEQRKKLGEARLLIISDYATNYATLTNEVADDLAKRIMKNDLEHDVLRKKYYTKIKKALSPLYAAQFMQIESYLQNVIRVSAQNQIPFIGEVKQISKD